jgi:hypothetical protein
MRQSLLCNTTTWYDKSDPKIILQDPTTPKAKPKLSQTDLPGCQFVLWAPSNQHISPNYFFVSVVLLRSCPPRLDPILNHS